MWFPILLLFLGAAVFFLIVFKLISLIPRVSRALSAVAAFVLTIIFCYVWLNNLAEQLTPMP